MWTSVNFDVQTKIDVYRFINFGTQISKIRWNIFKTSRKNHHKTFVWPWRIKISEKIKHASYCWSYFFSNLISEITLNSNAGLFGSSTATYCLWPDEAGACCPTGAGPSGTTGAGSGGADIAPTSFATTDWAFNPLKINSILINYFKLNIIN